MRVPWGMSRIPRAVDHKPTSTTSSASPLHRLQWVGGMVVITEDQTCSLPLMGNIIDSQGRGPPPPPMHSAYHSVPGGRSGEYDSPPGHHPDYLRDDPYDNRRSAHPGDGWNGGPGQRMAEGSIGGGGVHHGYGHFPMSPGMHGERGGGGGDMLQHFRPTIQPGPLFSHVAPPSVAPPSSGGMPPEQQGHMMHQQPPHHLQNMMRLAPPLHGGGGGGGGMGQHMMQQMPPQEQPHGRIPPPGFSPNEGRSMQSMHHGMQMPWNDPPINRSPLGGQHMSQQQHQQQSPFHLGGGAGGAPRAYLPGDRPGGIPGGSPMHHHPSVGSMSAPPPPFHSGNVQQGPHPAHSMQHSPIRQGNFNSSSSAGPGGGNSGGHNNGRFPRQGNMGNFQQQQPGFSRAPPPHQSVRPNRGAGHMSQGRGGMGARRGMGTPNTRPMALPKPVGEDAFPPKRPPLQDNPSQAIKVSPPKKRKVRKIVKNNLLEVETVDTLPDTTTTSDKEANAKEADNNTKPAAPLDPEVLEYQKKIERQKQLREEVLRRKEQRRKLMALQKQKELQEKAALSGETTSEVPKGNAIATIVNRNTVEPSPTLVQPSPIINKEPVVNQSFVAPMNPGQPTPEAHTNQAQLLAARKKALLALKAVRAQHGAQPMGRGMAIRGMRGGMGSQMVNQQIRSQNLVTVANSPMSSPQQQMGPRTKIIQVKNEEGQLVRKKVAIHPVMGGRVVPMGRGQSVEGSPQPGRPIVQGRGQVVVNSQGQQVQTPGAIQRVVQMLPPQQGIAQSPEPKAQANKMIQRVVKVNVPVPNQQQLQGRKVVVQNVGGAGGAGDCISADSPMPTGSVVVENLAVTTTEADLRKMCMAVGRVKSIRMVPGMRSAWVEFAHPNSAATFCQRYQRKIVDLSMITG
ncbi:uncharacterized protein LOC124163494 [Ischnura elegans]|uniref:uncharacterized protein LOC124163494 n=1 Tax=Ischnura elegans TaxID=197161 RepID=UPI001ED88B8F|nr:uncharacterized protein LOC124163494 [Ischnura elegans]